MEKRTNVGVRDTGGVDSIGLEFVENGGGGSVTVGSGGGREGEDGGAGESY
jgi:hypothetical protein